MTRISEIIQRGLGLENIIDRRTLLLKSFKIIASTILVAKVSSFCPPLFPMAIGAAINFIRDDEHPLRSAAIGASFGLLGQLIASCAPQTIEKPSVLNPEIPTPEVDNLIIGSSSIRQLGLWMNDNISGEKYNYIDQQDPKNPNPNIGNWYVKDENDQKSVFTYGNFAARIGHMSLWFDSIKNRQIPNPCKPKEIDNFIGANDYRGVTINEIPNIVRNMLKLLDKEEEVYSGVIRNVFIPFSIPNEDVFVRLAFINQLIAQITQNQDQKGKYLNVHVYDTNALVMDLKTNTINIQVFNLEPDGRLVHLKQDKMKEFYNMLTKKINAKKLL